MPLAGGQGTQNLGVQLTQHNGEGWQIMPTRVLLAHPDLKTYWYLLCIMYVSTYLST